MRSFFPLENVSIDVRELFQRKMSSTSWKKSRQHLVEWVSDSWRLQRVKKKNLSHYCHCNQHFFLKSRSDRLKLREDHDVKKFIKMIKTFLLVMKNHWIFLKRSWIASVPARQQPIVATRCRRNQIRRYSMENINNIDDAFPIILM